MHIKRQTISKLWPVPRKARTTYVVTPNFNQEKGLPILVVLRDILKVASNRKEVKQIIHDKNLLMNSKLVVDEKNSVVLFDTLTFVPSKKSFRLELSTNGKFDFVEIKENEAGKKISKIVDKKILRGKKVQLNFGDGRNILSNEKCNINDSAVLNFQSKKVEKIIPMKEKSKVLISEGKHIGVKGIIEEILREKKMAKISAEGKEFSVLIKQLIAIE